MDDFKSVMDDLKTHVVVVANHVLNKLNGIQNTVKLCLN